MTHGHEGIDIGKVVIGQGLHTAFDHFCPLLQKLGLISGLIDILVGVADELGQGLPILDPVHELSRRIGYQ